MHGSSSTLLLGDLLAEESLGLRLLTGGEEARRRPIAGAHSIEVEAPARWMAPRWVMLTTGLRLHERPDAQRRLICELDDAGIGALGFGVGVSAPAVPAALLETAETRGYPLFEVPLGTPFREIVTHVNRALLVPQAATLERLPAIHRYLFDALTQAEPDTTVLLRLASLLDAVVVLFGEDGVVEFATDEAPAAALWARIAERADTHLAEFELDGRDVVAVPTSVSIDGPGRWIAAYPRRTGVASQLVKPSVQAAAPLVAAIKRIDDLGEERERAQRAALLEAALDETDAARGRELEARALGFGLDFAAPVQLVVLARGARDGAADRGSAARRALLRLLVREGAPLLLAARDDETLALVQHEPAALRNVLLEVAAEHPGTVAGVSCTVDGLAQVRRALREARTALGVACEDGHAAVALFVECDLGALLVSQAQDERLRQTIARRLEPLHEQPQLYETLACYFANDLDVGASAKALYVHPNTMRNRLARIEELIGGSLRQPAVIAELHIALTTAPSPRSVSGGTGPS